MNILLTICARGGSKGVKNKNIKTIMGKPLICYTIKQAQDWGRANRIVVSTDSEEIAGVAEKAGVEIPFLRPRELASDQSGKLDAIRYTLHKCEEYYSEKYDIVVDLDVTAPIRKISDLEGAYRIFREKNADTLFSVVPSHKNPYFNMVEMNKITGEIYLCKLDNGGKRFLRRQDAPDVYDMNASIYFYRREYISNPINTSPICDKSAIWVMNEIAGIDIDREIDFRYVEFLIKEGIVEL